MLSTGASISTSTSLPLAGLIPMTVNNKPCSSTLALGRSQMQTNSFGAMRIGQKQMVTQTHLKSLARWSLSCAVQEKRASVICAAALNARCAAEQTQTVTRESSTITVAPVRGEEKSPELDDGGTGFPPRDDGDGGGGGGGGGGHWTGGFFFFGFLAFLGFLKDKESEGEYDDNRRRKNYSRM